MISQKTSKPAKNFSLKIFRLYGIVCVAMWPLVTYSNYFEIVSTVTFLDSLTGLISGTFLFKTVILYLYTINNDYTRYNIYSTWFLDIVISTCFYNVCTSQHSIHDVIGSYIILNEYVSIKLLD